VPGFVEIDLVSHDGGNAAGEHAWTLTVTDIATGWTENRSVPNKARKVEGPHRRESNQEVDIATTPHRRTERHENVAAKDTAILTDTYTGINPAAIQRQIQALTSELLTLTTSKAGPKIKAPVQ
jgi:hypothetical protein